MSVQIKSIAILLIMLIIGAIGGASITGMLVRERLEYIHSFSQVDGFVMRIEELIGPLTDEQRRQVEPLLEAAGEDVNTTFERFSQDFRSTVDQLQEDLSVYLTEEQIAQFEARRAEARNRYLGRYTLVPEDDASAGE